MPQKPKDSWDDLPDTDSWDELPDVTDMDKPLESHALGVAPESFARSVQESSPEPYQPSLWEKFRSPLTDMFSRAGQALEDFGGHPDYSQMDHLDPYQQLELSALSETPHVIGQAADSMTAPMNAIPALASMGTSVPVQMAGRVAGGLQAVSGIQNTLESTEPVGAGLGILETLGGALGALGKFGKTAPKVEPAPENVANIVNAAPPVIEPKIPITAPVIPEAPITRPTVLPSDLAGAKPRAYINQTPYLPQFESDIDKAMYIIAQKNPSKRDADYLKFLTEATGLDEKEIRQISATQKQQIIQQMKDSKVSGDIQIKKMWQSKESATPSKVNNLDYSPTSLTKAQKIVGENGLPMENLSANQIIDLAETLQPGHQVSRAASEVIDKAVAKPEAPKLKVRLNKDGTFTPEKYPDYKVDGKTGEIVGTHSGNPVDLKKVPEEVKRGFITEAGNTARAMVGSMDMSFPLRQGLGLAHKGAWWKAWGPMVKSFGSDKAFQAVQDSIAAKPFAQGKNVMEGGKAVYKPSVYERAGLAITDNSTARELEHFKSKAENLPWVKASNRAYTAFANKLRSDTFDSIVSDFAKAGVDVTKDDVTLKNIGEFINNASGRGSLNGLERYADVLNATLFSPRLIEARMKMFGNTAMAVKDIALDPKQFAMSAPSVQKEYLKSMTSIAGAWMAMAGLASQAGADVSLDPTSSDFGKIKVGNTRLDPAGGFQQFLVLGSRVSKLMHDAATGQMEGGPFSKSVMDVGGDFLYNKEAPLTRYVHDFLKAKDNKVDRMDVPDATARLIAPIIVQNLLEIYGSGGQPAEMLTTVPDFFGVGTQTYGKDIRRRMLGDFGSDLTYPQRKGSIFN